MYGVSKCHHITHLNLPNNHIICIEGLKDMLNLTFLNLSVNNIKAIQNLQHSINLVHLDLSRNNICAISDISCLSKLEVLHLNGNKISSLDRVPKFLPSSICVLSLADNCITDLNEVSNLVKLHCLEQITMSGNPCLSPERFSLPPFDYRPFIINWCLGLRLLDGGVATQKESLRAEWLYSQGKGRHYKPGEHAELIEYLCQVCPITADQCTTEEEDEKLIRILQKQRQHKEQFLNEMSQSSVQVNSEPSRPQTNAMTQSYHFKTDTPSKTQETAMSASCVFPSKIMYESAPEVLFAAITEPGQQNIPSLFQSRKYPRSVSKSEILHNAIKSPIMIEHVEVETSPIKSKPQESVKSQYQHYEDRKVRPSSSEPRPTHTPKGTLIRKVSKRATSPCTSAPPGSRSRLPHSTAKSRISPSRSCILNARLSAAKNSSESDTSEEVSHTRRLPQRSFRSLSTDTQSGHNSPIMQQSCHAALSPTKRAFGLESSGSSGPDRSPRKSQLGRPETLSEKYGKSNESIRLSATKIQAAWRGYHVRHHNHRVLKLLQEIRFRRLEDHIQHLHGHLCRLTDVVLRQQQDLQHERELRKVQAEDIRHLHEKAKDLQKNVSVALSKTKVNVFQNLSEQGTPNRDSRDGGMLHDSKLEKQQSSDSLNLALRYTSQMYQENTSMYSPSSQASSITSFVPENYYGKQRSRRDMQPSASDVSDADSGLQSITSPTATASNGGKHNISLDITHPTFNGFADDSGFCMYKDNVGGNVLSKLNEKDSQYEDILALQAKLGAKQIKPMSALRHPLPVATIPSAGSDICLVQPSHLPSSVSRAYFGKNLMSFNKNSFEFPNSSVENSPCSINGDSFMLSRQQLHSNFMSNTLPNTRIEETSKRKNNIVNGNSTDVTPQDGTPGGSSKSFMSHLMKDKMYAHHNRCSKSCIQSASKPVEKALENADPNYNSKNSVILPKRLSQLAQNKLSSPLEDKDSPSSPCTVEMSGCISHSCSFQSDGFASEELSATATVKLFSSRAVSMTCANGTISPQTSAPRTLSLSDASPQASLRSPLVLAASVWEKKVQDIESTFQQLQTQIRDLEGAFGQIGQFGQFFYPGMLPDELKESLPALHCGETSPSSLVLDMPKINFRRADSGCERLFQNRYPNSVPYLPSHSSAQHQQNQSDCRVEEIEPQVSPLPEEPEDLSNSISEASEAKS